MYDINELADMLSDYINETGKERWSAKDIKQYFLSEGINLSLDEILQVWKACPNPVCASILLGCNDSIFASDYEPAAQKDLSLGKVVIQFGDGNGAASRGTELDNDCEIYGYVSSEAIAFAAALFVDALYDGGNGFTDMDVIECLKAFRYYEDWVDGPDEEVLRIAESKGADYWKRELRSLDIGDGSPCVYRIEYNGKEIYFDEWLMEEVRGEHYDDDDDEDDEYYEDTDSSIEDNTSIVYICNGDEVSLEYVADKVKDYLTNVLPEFISNDPLSDITDGSISNYSSGENISRALADIYRIYQKFGDTGHPISESGMKPILNYFGVSSTFQLPEVFGL